jgi:hypothetical protein
MSAELYDKIAEAKKVLAELEKQLPPPYVSNINERVLKLADKSSSNIKQAFKQAIDEGLVVNIDGFLRECHDAFVDEYSENAITIMGKHGEFTTLKWDNFVFSVIERLFKKKVFTIEEDGCIDTFEDTAGGCDEIVWTEACKIIEKL